MLTLLIAVGSFVGYYIAYHTYGRWLSRKIFNLDEEALVPSKEVNDGVDYVPTDKQVVFGHHFTSIAGTGPIVGPSLAVFWGWLPALLWVFFGSIFIGAVHDLGSLIVSLRNRGQTIGEVAGRLISPRARVLFLLILFFSLMIVLAIFGLVIASIFSEYPQSVLGTWISLPIAVVIGLMVHRKNKNLLIPTIMGLAGIYLCVYLGVYGFSNDVSGGWHITLGTSNDKIAWTGILLTYAFVASVLPVWLMLQPRDYINSYQLFVALFLLVAGVVLAGLLNRVDLANTTPAIAENLPSNAPPIFPFLFITIACGACSGFHCLVSSGTSSKQVSCEPDAQMIGYGSMLLEGALAVIVILCCTAGLGMGITENGEVLTKSAAWESRYLAKGDWNSFKLKDMVSAFIDGGANFLTMISMPKAMAVGIIAVLVACFAATTLDSACRLQRYVVEELASTFRFKPLQNRYMATLFAVITGMIIAMIPGPAGMGSGGLILWPLFGATNQLLAGLAFLVIIFYLWRRKLPIWFITVPAIFMLILPMWGMYLQIFAPETGFFAKENYLLTILGCLIMCLQVWMIFEGLLIIGKTRGVLELQLAPYAGKEAKEPTGPAC